MESDRRSFIERLVAIGALCGVSPASVHAAAATAAFDNLQADDEQGVGNAYAFWSNYLAQRAGSPSQHDLFSHKSKDKGIEETRQVNFLHYDSHTNALRFPAQVSPDELLDFPGDVTLNIQVGGIRLSQADQAAFESLQSAQLRVDMSQNKELMNIAKLAWASVAAIFPTKQGKLPSLQDLGFSPESTKNIVLPGGSGALGVNVSMTRRESNFYKMLKIVVPQAGKFSPIIGLPAISITALNAVYTLYGLWEDRTTFLFQTQAPVQAYATKSARQEANTSIGVNLVDGDYIVVPQQHVDAIQPHLGDYKLSQGYLLPKDASDAQSVYDLAAKTPPDISYLSLNVKVAPYIQGATSATAVGGSSAGSSAGAGSAGGRSGASSGAKTGVAANPCSSTSVGSGKKPGS